ncbi:hypothetical protein PGT21_024163 [Puccinia graminis f. sp. tritici]|uniref:Uncharacterized protein n=1 Tax=Puccinia graminis f. sp. tritici TaxID=56615 RepID=A0A5B0LY98_PUCGR|nr:hypothetical protein PGT21_024163 [Puccinia graminis f. sp. tritici]
MKFDFRTTLKHTTQHSPRSSLLKTHLATSDSPHYSSHSSVFVPYLPATLFVPWIWSAKMGGNGFKNGVLGITRRSG